jgi:hypothetical protein
VVRAYGVDAIVTVARSRPPWDAGDIFPVVKAFIHWISMDGGLVELLIRLGNTQWLPWHVKHSWEPDDDLRLMKSAFGHRYMIMGGWGENLFPRDPSWKVPKDRTEDLVEDREEDLAEDGSEVKLEEYHSWSQGSWDQGTAEGKDITAPIDWTLPTHGQRGGRG